jgi:restriction system protein
MKLEMHKNSIFAVLMRSPWWVSVLVAVGIVALMRLMVPIEYALFGALPFAVIAVHTGWRELRAPSPQRVATALERVRAMSWEQFSAALEEAWRREGYAVSRVSAPHADFELDKGARITLVACKRWKATRTGVEPLRELKAAREARGAHEAIYVAAGEVTAQALQFAGQNKLRLMQGAELAKITAQ